MRVSGVWKRLVSQAITMRYAIIQSLNIGPYSLDFTHTQSECPYRNKEVTQMKKTTSKSRSKGSNKETQKVIGTVTTYLGNEKRLGSHGTKMLVTAVLKRKFDERLVPDRDPGCDYIYVSDNDELERLGGLAPMDTVEVQCWHPTENRWCAVCDESNLKDLEAFKNLR